MSAESQFEPNVILHLKISRRDIKMYIEKSIGMDLKIAQMALDNSIFTFNNNGVFVNLNDFPEFPFKKLNKMVNFFCSNEEKLKHSYRHKDKKRKR